MSAADVYCGSLLKHSAKKYKGAFKLYIIDSLYDKSMA